MAARKDHEIKDKRLNLRVSEKMYERLEALADRESNRRGVDLGISWVARWLIERALVELVHDDD